MSNLKCKSCDNPLSLKIMKIIEGECWKCNDPIKVAVMHSPNGYIRHETHPGPDLFTEEEIKFAESKGVLISLHHSHTADDTYFANTCGKCNAFVGSHYLFSQYFMPAKNKDIKYESFEIGYHCEECYVEEEMNAYNEKYGES